MNDFENFQFESINQQFRVSISYPEGSKVDPDLYLGGDLSKKRKTSERLPIVGKCCGKSMLSAEWSGAGWQKSE